MKLHKTLLSLITFLSIASLSALSTPNYDRFIMGYRGNVIIPDTDRIDTRWLASARENLRRDGLYSDENLKEALWSKLLPIVDLTINSSARFSREPELFKNQIRKSLNDGIDQLGGYTKSSSPVTSALATTTRPTTTEDEAKIDINMNNFVKKSWADRTTTLQEYAKKNESVRREFLNAYAKARVDLIAHQLKKENVKYLFDLNVRLPLGDMTQFAKTTEFNDKLTIFTYGAVKSVQDAAKLLNFDINAMDSTNGFSPLNALLSAIAQNETFDTMVNSSSMAIKNLIKTDLQNIAKYYWKEFINNPNAQSTEQKPVDFLNSADMNLLVRKPMSERNAFFRKYANEPSAYNVLQAYITAKIELFAEDLSKSKELLNSLFDHSEKEDRKYQSDFMKDIVAASFKLGIDLSIQKKADEIRIMIDKLLYNNKSFQRVVAPDFITNNQDKSVLRPVTQSEMGLSLVVGYLMQCWNEELYEYIAKQVRA